MFFIFSFFFFLFFLFGNFDQNLNSFIFIHILQYILQYIKFNLMFIFLCLYVTLSKFGKLLIFGKKKKFLIFTFYYILLRNVYINVMYIYRKD